MKELSRRLMDGLDDLAGLDMILWREAGSDQRGDYTRKTGHHTKRNGRWWSMHAALRVVERWLAYRVNQSLPFNDLDASRQCLERPTGRRHH